MVFSDFTLFLNKRILIIVTKYQKLSARKRSTVAVKVSLFVNNKYELPDVEV